MFRMPTANPHCSGDQSTNFSQTNSTNALSPAKPNPRKRPHTSSVNDPLNDLSPHRDDSGIDPKRFRLGSPHNTPPTTPSHARPSPELDLDIAPFLDLMGRPQSPLSPLGGGLKLSGLDSHIATPSPDFLEKPQSPLLLLGDSLKPSDFSADALLNDFFNQLPIPSGFTISSDQATPGKTEKPFLDPYKKTPKLSQKYSTESSLNGLVLIKPGVESLLNDDLIWCRHISLSYYLCDEKKGGFLKENMQNEKSMQEYFSQDKINYLDEMMMNINDNGMEGVLSDTNCFGQYLEEAAKNLEHSQQKSTSLLLTNPTHIMSAHLQLKESPSGEKKYRLTIMDPYQSSQNHLALEVNNPEDFKSHSGEALFGNYHRDHALADGSAPSLRVICKNPKVEPHGTAYTSSPQSISHALESGRLADFNKILGATPNPEKNLEKIVNDQAQITATRLICNPDSIRVLAQALDASGLDNTSLIKMLTLHDTNVGFLVADLTSNPESAVIQNLMKALSVVKPESYEEAKSILHEKIAGHPSSDVGTLLNLECCISKYAEAGKASI